MLTNRALFGKRMAGMVMNGFRATSNLPLTAVNSFSTPVMVRQFSSTDDASDSDFMPKSKLTGGSDEVTKHISQWIAENDVVVFMKGSRKMPQCGFSRYVAVLLNAYGVKQYKDVNVLESDELRQTIKDYSNWPTIPQVYIKGEFIGGCDIMKEMHEDGSLRELLSREGIIKE